MPQCVHSRDQQLPYWLKGQGASLSDLSPSRTQDLSAMGSVSLLTFLGLGAGSDRLVAPVWSV